MLIPPPNRQVLNTSQIQVHVPSRNNMAIQQEFNQPFQGQSQLQTRKSFCYVFNNKDGWCPRGNNCPCEHICQFCGSGNHTTKLCPSNTKIVNTRNRQVNRTFASKQNYQTFSIYSYVLRNANDIGLAKDLTIYMDLIRQIQKDGGIGTVMV